VSGLVVANYSVEFNHWNADKSLDEWLRENKVPALSSVDTRALTRLIREKGSLLGKLVYENQDVDFYDPDKENLVDQVCSGDITEYGSGKYKIVIVDCGVKNNIIRHVLKRDTNVIRVPWNYDFTGDDFDGVVVSNGPGNPVHCQETIEILSRAMKKEKPVMGICLGNQLMAMAAGAEAYKLKYGHRSHNQPVILKDSNKAYITSQNHGYAIRQDSLSKGWEPFFINLNDGTNEGIRHTSKPFFSVQFHPEASSGPTDTEFLFDDFIDLVRKYKLVTHA
jgi:carbamoyl-phosphate synthase small subunit